MHIRFPTAGQLAIEEGMIVIVCDDSTLNWTLGHVFHTIKGTDGYIRVVVVKTKNGIIQLSIVELASLPWEEEDESK